MTFLSLTEQIKTALSKIIPSNELHIKWLNTLSYLENCGARKIAACEHPTLVKEEMLKHAAEEFRHAHYLKRQIKRLTPFSPPNYSLPYLLGETAALHYLTALDLKTCRYLTTEGCVEKVKIKEIAYYLVTFAIERRARELYEEYDLILRQFGSKVIVKPILLEEEEHLAEMQASIVKIPNGMQFAEKVCGIETELCQKWMNLLT